MARNVYGFLLGCKTPAFTHNLVSQSTLSHEPKAELVVKALRRAPFRRDGPLNRWPWPALDADQTSESA